MVIESRAAEEKGSGSLSDTIRAKLKLEFNQNM